MNIICGIGVIPYILLYYLFGSFIALSIFINGIIHHIAIYNVKSRIYDIICNVLYIFYINVTQIYIYTTHFTLLACLFYLINCKLKSNIVHVLLIQWLFLFLLYKNI